MSINALPDKSPVVVSKDVLLGSTAWLEFFRSIFYALFGWKRTFTTTLAKTWGLIASDAEASQTVTVMGARTGDAVLVTPGARTAGIVDNIGIVTANDTVTVYAQNPTGGGITPGAKTYRIIVFQQ